MLKKTILILLVLSFYKVQSQITLNTNIGSDLINSGMTSCDSYDEAWYKVFDLSDFGITTNDQFIIETGQVGISKSYGGAGLSLGVFAIDDNFPNTYADPINGGGHHILPEINNPTIVNFNIDNPIVVPASVKKILVVVVKSDDFYNPKSSEVIIAGTEKDTGSSWYTGCREYY